MNSQRWGDGMKEVYASKREEASRKIVLGEMERDNARSSAVEAFKRPAYGVKPAKEMCRVHKVDS
jgi:hypothetical protein